MNQILQTLTDKYGRVQRLTGGFTNATYLLDGTTPLVAKVATLSNQDLLNEMNVLHYLNGKGISPDFIDSLTIESSSILITTYKPGTNGQSILDTGNMVKAISLFIHMGIHLARDIHSISYAGANTPLRIGSSVQTNIDFVPEVLQSQSETYLNQINMNPSTWVLTHGDYGSHNILFEEKEPFTVIDWEWAEWFHPFVDIAWACWNTKLHYPKIAGLLNETFIKAYQSIRPIECNDNQVKIYVLYKLWNILNRVQHADVATQEKWVGRLEWTLKTKII